MKITGSKRETEGAEEKSTLGLLLYHSLRFQVLRTSREDLGVMTCASHMWWFLFFSSPSIPTTRYTPVGDTDLPSVSVFLLDRKFG